MPKTENKVDIWKEHEIWDGKHIKFVYLDLWIKRYGHLKIGVISENCRGLIVMEAVRGGASVQNRGRQGPRCKISRSRSGSGDVSHRAAV